MEQLAGISDATPEATRVDRVLGELGIPKDSMAGRRELERVMEGRREAEEGGTYKPIRRGWFFGEKAERVVREELRRRRWTEATLGERKKGEVAKVKIAIRLRNETLVTVAWIVERLRMGSVANVNTLLYHWRQGKRKK